MASVCLDSGSNHGSIDTRIVSVRFRDSQQERLEAVVGYGVDATTDRDILVFEEYGQLDKKVLVRVCRS